MKDAGGAFIGWRDDPVMPPLPFPPGNHDACPAQVSKMPGNPRLRNLQDFDEEAHADLVLPIRLISRRRLRSDNATKNFSISNFLLALLIPRHYIIYICIDEYIFHSYADIKLIGKTREGVVTNDEYDSMRRRRGSGDGIAAGDSNRLR